MQRLTALFARAKFSQHEVDDGMKDEAIDTLEELRDELRAARDPRRGGARRSARRGARAGGRMIRVVLARPSRSRSLPTAVLIVVLVLAPGRAELAVHVYVLVLLAAALASVVGSIASQARSGESPFDAALHRPTEEDERLPELVRLEREVALAQASPSSTCTTV